jgi:hypothetical protein
MIHATGINPCTRITTSNPRPHVPASMSSPPRTRSSLASFTSTNRPRLFAQKQQLEATVQEVKDSGQWATFYNDLLFSLFTALSQVKREHSEALSDLAFYGWQPFGQLRLWEEGG